MVSLGYTIYLLAVLLATHVLVFSDAFIPSKSQTMFQGAKDRKQEGRSPPAGWGQMEETFVASSTGEGMEVIDMVQSEEEQRLRNSVMKDLLLDLAISLNTGSIMLFFLCVT
ncbi:sperm-egg fusion protein LLCFC1 [Emydura macquarii macquarii]|uniref:sperm-egg fusion protein LLCFC1 n=1 Tax=Emydura macquarii macquarii TaxID=1129001 RepID=UPI00352AAA6C